MRQKELGQVTFQFQHPHMRAPNHPLTESGVSAPRNA